MNESKTLNITKEDAAILFSIFLKKMPQLKIMTYMEEFKESRINERISYYTVLNDMFSKHLEDEHYVFSDEDNHTSHEGIDVCVDNDLILGEFDKISKEFFESNLLSDTRLTIFGDLDTMISFNDFYDRKTTHYIKDCIESYVDDIEVSEHLNICVSI